MARWDRSPQTPVIVRKPQGKVPEMQQVSVGTAHLQRALGVSAASLGTGNQLPAQQDQPRAPRKIILTPSALSLPERSSDERLRAHRSPLSLPAWPPPPWACKGRKSKGGKCKRRKKEKAENAKDPAPGRTLPGASRHAGDGNISDNCAFPWQSFPPSTGAEYAHTRRLRGP